MNKQWPMYRDMTDEQIEAWGQAERDARMADLSIRGADGLIDAQRNATARRLAIGASINQAASAVNAASRAKRRAEMLKGDGNG